MAERFWSDTFDMDLLARWPDLPDRLGVAANLPLWTHGGESYGRLNHPSVWGTWGGMVAYFGLTPDTGKPESHYTQHPVIECTWLETLRDAWPHSYQIVVADLIVWDTQRLQSTFTKLMYDLRGWRRLPDGQADRLRGGVLASILAATHDLQQLAAGVDRG